MTRYIVLLMYSNKILKPTVLGNIVKDSFLNAKNNVKFLLFMYNNGDLLNRTKALFSTNGLNLVYTPS
jgi:hypothetical protein